MNEKINYLSVFFQHERDQPQFKSEDLVDHFPDLIFVYDVERRRLQYGNRRFTEFTGRESRDLKEWDGGLVSLLHPQDSICIDKLIDSVNHPNASLSGYCRARLSDGNGHYHSYQLKATALKRKEDGLAQLVLFVAQDMTEALKRKDEIETTSELLDETEELLQFGSWSWDISTNTVTWTAGLYSLLGYSRQELPGNISLEFYISHLPEEYAQPFHDIIHSALKEKTDFSYEYIIKTHSGQLKNISTKGRLVKDEHGEVVKMLCINRDITALKSFEKEQERNIRELNRSNRDLEEFAYIASHDMQEPLRKISMFTERLKAKYDNALDNEGQLFIERILISTGNMRTLIDNLLDFSRANRRSHTFDQVNIQSVLENVISELELKIEETKARINFSGTFPTLEAVTSEMTQLFSNILSNAIKFRKNQVVPEVSVRATKLNRTEKHVLGLAGNNHFHKIEVQDNGIGFEPEYAEKIFQIFQRLNGKSEYPGSGIGLAICKKIVEKHNGLIFAHSQPDEGATFTIILPEKQF
ncbi:MAG: ATP-binding protein [Chryseosolibacter sp.]